MTSLKSIFSKLSNKKIIVIEHASIENTLHIVGVKVSVKSGEFEIEDKFECYKVEEITSHIPKNKAVSLIVNTNQILSKKIEGTGTGIQQVNKAFPNVNLDDFYYEVYQTTAYSFVSICRKGHINSLIDSYKKEGIFIINFTFGTVQGISLIPYINTTNLTTLNSQLIVDNEQLIDCNNNIVNEIATYVVGEQQITSKFALPLAFIIDSLGGGITLYNNFAEARNSLKKQFAETRFFKQVLTWGISGLLLALLVNFFIFSSKFDKLQRLQDEKQLFTTQQKQLEKRIASVKQKENVVNSILSTGFSKSAYYTDQIILSQPESIVLSDFIYQPINKSIRKNKEIAIEKNKIKISGISSIKSEFTNWLKQMENLEFVDFIVIESYGIKKGTNANFEIALTLLKE